MTTIVPGPSDTSGETHREAALAACREQAFTITNEDSPDFGRRLIHCFRGFIGADWDLAAVLTLIQDAERVEWGPDLVGHNLRVVADGKLYRFDVQETSEVSS